MRKLLVILLILMSASSYSQDTISYVQEEAVEFSDANVDFEQITLRTMDKNFKKKYTDRNFIYEVKAQEKTAWDRFVEWLAMQLRNLLNMTDPEKAVSVTKVLLRIISAVIIIFVVYLIVKQLMDKDGRWIFGRSRKSQLIDYDAIEKNLHASDFEKLIAETIAAGNPRLAIRYYYLWLLKKMSESEIIVWDPDKTNSDYHREIIDTKRRDEFAYLSYLYNYIWYGEIEPDENTFAKAKLSFEKSIKSIR